jgi:hypothetical protein
MPAKRKKRSAVFIEEAQIQGLQALQELHGTPMAVTIRRAIDAYLQDHKDEVQKGLRLLKQK